MKELTQALNSYMTNTSEEIENIKKIIEVNYKVTITENKKDELSKKDMESKIQYVINMNKELILKHEELESLVIGMTENSPKI